MQPQFRLRSRVDFQRVQQGGRSWAHPLLVLSAVGNGLDYTRVGFLVSRRLGGAVGRNRARRLLREAARRQFAAIRPGWDVVLIGRPGLVKEKLQPVAGALETLLRRADLLAGPKASEG